MLSFLHAVDRLSTKVGHLFSWLIVALTLMISYEVFTRYALNHPNPWVFDMSYILYGIHFMMAGAYTLAANGHVRGDIMYGFFSARTQATLDLILYFVFFLPGVIALTYAGYYFAEDAWVIKEMSSTTADGPAIYPFKAFIPLAGAFLLFQGIVEIIRCIICIRDGAWPKREDDVEEVDVEKMKAMVGQK
ncbi:TRAP transporter small permease subunit [Limnobacter sp.]|uniref:TRAP transporter small permease subunit n=1 Tax=Limnobacter sp. TaxID=2003368 RepID=UPI0035119D19